MELTEVQHAIDFFIVHHCPDCNGDGFTAEHDSNDPHEFGCCTNCPVQVQCDTCQGTGVKPNDYKEKITELPHVLEDDMPF